jgi:Tfp pilus assembly protein PilN
MIKINLLPQKRTKRAQVNEPGSRDFIIGVVSVAAAAAIVFFAVDQPKRSHLNSLREANDQLQEQINTKNQQLQGYQELKTAADESDARAQSINRLMQAKVVPANVLHELGEILALGRQPTMTEEMALRTGNGPQSDPNRRFDLQWDPAHVWLTGYTDKDGVFKLEGGAQAEVDVTQLSKRLQASVYFMDVAPSQEERVSDKDVGVDYYKFTITGRVAY